MLDRILSRLKDEIGIDGTQGSNIPTVWKHLQDILNAIVQESNVSIAPVIDENYKGFIWEYIKTMEDITFYIKHDAPVPVKKIKKKEKKTSGDKKTASTAKKRKAADDSDDDYEGGDSSEEEEEEEEKEEEELESEEEEEEEEKVVKKKSNGRKKDENIEREPKKSNEVLDFPDQNLDNFEEMNITDLSYADIKELGDKLHVVASQKIQDEQLYYGLPPDCNLSPNVTIFLREILKCRAAGFYQAYLTKHFNLDARSTGHYCKVLEEKGAITRQRVTVKGFYTNICIHVRFKHAADNGNLVHTSDSAPFNMNSRGEYITSKDICVTIIELAKDANEKTIMARDVLYALGFESNKHAIKKWFNRCIHDLYESGYIKKLKTQVNGQGPMLRCIQLLKDTMDDAPKDINLTEKIEFPINVEPINSKRMPSRGVFIDLALSRQVFINIENSGQNGITQREMAVALNSDNSRLLYRYLELLSAKIVTNYDRFYICRHIEFEKRVRRYRYFSLKNYKRLTENDETYTDPPLPESEFDETKLFELDWNFNFEHNRKAYMAVLKNSFREPSGTGLRSQATGKRIGRPPKKSKQSKEGETPTATKRTTRKNAKGKGKTTATPQSSAAQPEETVDEAQPNEAQPNEAQPNETQPNEAQPNVAQPNVAPPAAALTEDVTMDEAESNAPGLSNEPQVDLLKEPEIHSKRVVACKARQTRSQHPTTGGESSSSKRSAFGILMSSSRTRSNPEKKAPSPPPASQDEETETVSMIKIAPSCLVKPEKIACAKVAAAEAAAAAAKEIDSIIATEELEQETHASAKRKKTKQSEKSQKRSKRGNESVEATSSQPSTSQAKKKSLFDYFGKSKANPTVNKETTPPAVNEAEQMETESTVPQVPEEAVGEEGQERQDENGDKQGQGNQDEEEEQTSSPQQAPTEERPFTASVFTHVERYRPTKAVNRYMELRKKALMILVEKNSAFVSNKASLIEFLEVYNQINNTKTAHIPQKKTLLTTAKKLVEDGLVHLRTKIVRGKGKNAVEHFVIVPSAMDLGGEEFKKIYDGIEFDSGVHGVVPQFVKIQRFDAPVEGLDDRLEKMKKDLEEKRMTSSARQITTIESRLDRYASNAKSISKSEPAQIGATGTEWRALLDRTGFITPKLIRVRALHKYILSLWIEQGDILHEDSIIIPSTTIVGKMTAFLYLQVIGNRQLPTKATEFLSNPDNKDMVIEDFPQDIAAPVVSKIRQFLRMLLNILEFLGIVEPESNGPNIVQRAYRVKKKIDLYDIRYKKEFADVKTYTIVDEESFNGYWGALRYLATLHTTLVKEHLKPRLESDRDREYFTSIFSARSWSMIFHYTPDQLDLLNYYIDEPNYKTPVNDLELCVEISQVTGLSIEAVHSYYEKLQKRLEKKVNAEFAQSGGRRRISKKSRRGDKYNRLGIVRKGNIKMSRHVKEGAKENEILTMEGDINYDLLTKTRAKRSIWTDQDDEILVYSYILIKSRALTKSDFRWRQTLKLFPDRTSNSVRTHFDKIILRPRIREKIIACQLLWTRFYKEGIQNGDIVDETPNDTVNFDILSFMEYFIIRLNEVQSSKIIELPSATKELENNFEIILISFDKNHDPIDARLINQIRRKTDLLKRAFCSHISTEYKSDSPLNAFETESTFEGRQKKLIKLLYLMTLYSSEETYNPINGYLLISEFPQSLRESVFADMREEGALIHAKRERSIPTSSYTLSAKFIHSMVDKFPKSFYSEARTYETYLRHSKKVLFDPHAVVDGTMACLLSLVSQGRLDITVPNRKEQMQKFEFMNSRSKNIKVDMAYFDINFEINNRPSLDNPTSTLVLKDQNVLVSVSKDNADNAFPQMISTQLPQRQHALANDIVTFLKEREELGASVYQVKLHISGASSDKDILDCLTGLEKATIIISVGVDSERYVLSVPQFIESWTLNMNHGAINIADKRDCIINPTIWTNIQGDITPVVLEECTRRIYGIIMRSPGITEATIHRHVNKLFTKKEIRFILKQLVEKNILKVFRVSFKKASKPLLFSQPRSTIRTTQNTISECTESSYWPSPNYYNAVI